MFQRILVPVDFTPCSDAALDHALVIADAWGAEVELLHVWAPSDRTIFAETAEGLALQKRLSEAEHAHPAKVSGRLEFGGDPASVILDVLERGAFDMVVMGRHAPGRVAEQVASRAPCAVVTLRTAALCRGVPRACSVARAPDLRDRGAASDRSAQDEEQAAH